MKRKVRHIRGLSKKRPVQTSPLTAPKRVYAYYYSEYIYKMLIGELIVVCQARGISTTTRGNVAGYTHAHILRSRLRTWQKTNMHRLVELGTASRLLDAP